MPDAETLPAPQEDLALLLDAVRAGGALALEHFGKSPKTWIKGESSVVSEADMVVDALMAERLRPARPDYGWLSEETADSMERLSRKRLFVVDPIDGTRAFLRGSDEWTVCAAVVENGRPIAAALLAAARGTIYEATVGGGARRDGAAIHAAGATRLGPGRLAGPRPLFPALRGFDGAETDDIPRVASLSLRLTLVAEAGFDAALASKNAWDWDLAAADLILAEAGGHLTDFAGERPLYNRARPRHPALLAAGPGLHRRMLDHIAQAA